ncbi:MAG: TorF family putative porin [Pseudobdellovibrionaceae bacterium]
MKYKATSKLILNLSILLTSIFFSVESSAQTEEKSDIPSFKMNGDLGLLSNFVKHGLTQTNKDPSLQGDFNFNFGPQFKMGLWGSNVNYLSTEHFLLRLNAELKVQISSTTDFKLGIFNNHYFKTNSRDGNTTYLLVTTHDYRIRYESETNWEGTQSSSTYFSFGKLTELSQAWNWDNEVGYTMVGVSTMSNYFDLRTSFVYKGGNNILYQITGTATSAPSQFSNGQGDTALLVGASTNF